MYHQEVRYSNSLNVPITFMIYSSEWLITAGEKQKMIESLRKCDKI